jgi:hypothetical protein
MGYSILKTGGSIMAKDIFSIDPRIWELDDPRIASLANKEVTQAQFMGLIKPEDPFEMRNGRLTYISPEDVAKRIEDYTNSYKVQISLSGGITGGFILDNKNAFLQVYPEMAVAIKNVEDIITKENCKGCARNRHAQTLQTELTKMPKDRDISSLVPLFKSLPYAADWLTGKIVQVDPAQLQLPPFFKKADIPKRLGGPLTPGTNSTPVKMSQPEDEYTLGRKQCIDCGKKHVGQALVLLREAEKGYPEHVELAYKHLKSAEKDVPEDKKLSFTKMFHVLEDELKVLDLKKIHNITTARKLLEDYLKDPNDPAHLPRWVAVGHLAEAEDEMVNDYPELTGEIRRERMALMSDPKYSPPLEMILRKIVNTAPKT